MNSKTELNIAENRNHLNYSKWIYVKRILWTFGKFFFRNSPRIAFGYIWGIERSGFFNGREKWAKGFENQRV